MLKNVLLEMPKGYPITGRLVLGLQEMNVSLYVDPANHVWADVGHVSGLILLPEYVRSIMSSAEDAAGIRSAVISYAQDYHNHFTLLDSESNPHVWAYWLDKYSTTLDSDSHRYVLVRNLSSELMGDLQ